MIGEKYILLIVAVSLVLIGLIFGGIFVGLRISDRNKRSLCTRRVKGTVTDIERRRTSGSMGDAPMISWYPTFKYEVNGYTIEKTSMYGSAKQDFYINQEVTVFYNPQNPNEYYVQEENVASICKVFLTVAAVLLMAGGITLGFYICFFDKL